MASKLNIINLALTHIAQTNITQVQLDAATTTVQAKVALALWEITRQQVLRSYNWAFAKVQEALVVTTDYDPVIYDYAYVYPANCLAIRKVNVQTQIDEAISGLYEVMLDTDNSAKRIVTDIEDAYIEYTYDIDTPSLFDSAFVVAFARRLAAEMVIPFGGDKELAREQAELANATLSDAKRHDSSLSGENRKG